MISKHGPTCRPVTLPPPKELESSCDAILQSVTACLGAARRNHRAMLRSPVLDHVEAATKEGSLSTSRNIPILPSPVGSSYNQSGRLKRLYHYLWICRKAEF